MKNKILFSCFLTLLLSLLLLPGKASAQTDGKTAEDAIEWVQEQVGTSIDVDGAFGAQCVDLIKAYYLFLGQKEPHGNGADYATNDLPEGWERIEGAQPQKGDILVYSATEKHPYGHVGIYEADDITYHQNFGGKQYVQEISLLYNSFQPPYWGVIRPDFMPSDPQVNTFVTDGKYTYYIQADGTYMKDRLTYHPDGEHVIYFDPDGHEVFNTFAHVTLSISGEEVDDYCYFNTFGYMYVNTVTYDETGTKLYYINPCGKMENSGWFSFDPDAAYGDTEEKWHFTGSLLGYAQEDGTLLTNAKQVDEKGKKRYLQGNGEAK